MANSIKQITKNCFRALLDPIAAQGSTTIGFSDKTVAADLSMIAPNWKPHEMADAVVSLQDQIQVEIIRADDDVTDPTPLSVIKAGTTHADFVITIHNDNAAEGPTSPDLEVYVTWGGH